MYQRGSEEGSWNLCLWQMLKQMKKQSHQSLQLGEHSFAPMCPPKIRKNAMKKQCQDMKLRSIVPVRQLLIQDHTLHTAKYS